MKTRLSLVRMLIAPFVVIIMTSCTGTRHPVAGTQVFGTEIPLPTVNPNIMPSPTVIAQTFQIIKNTSSPEVLLAQQTEAGKSVWADGDELTFLYHGEADEVRVCCGLQLPMYRVENSDLWVLTVKIQNLSQAVLTYFFQVTKNGQPIEPPQPIDVWRGADAPPPVRHAQPLLGQIKGYELESIALNEKRNISVYIPPQADLFDSLPVIYAADGQDIPAIAEVLEPLITDGTLSPILLVGVHSPEGPLSDPNHDLRTWEYIPGENPERFAAHERFFVDEVAQWAESELHADSRPENRAVFGFSSGGVFAAVMGLRHPDKYGHIFAFSLGWEPGAIPSIPVDAMPGFYLVAGTLEEGFYNTTRPFAWSLQERGIKQVFKGRVCGHDFIMWQEEFPAAVLWAFGQAK